MIVSLKLTIIFILNKTNKFSEFLIYLYCKNESNIERGMLMKINLEQNNNDIFNIDRSVLSVYSKTDPTNENWKIRLNNNLKRTKHLVKSSQSDNINIYNEISKKVNQAIRDRAHELKHGFVCFANVKNILLYDLQIPIEKQCDLTNKDVTDKG